MPQKQVKRKKTKVKLSTEILNLEFTLYEINIRITSVTTKCKLVPAEGR